MRQGAGGILAPLIHDPLDRLDPLFATHWDLSSLSPLPHTSFVSSGVVRDSCSGPRHRLHQLD